MTGPDFFFWVVAVFCLTCLAVLIRVVTTLRPSNAVRLSAVRQRIKMAKSAPDPKDLQEAEEYWHKLDNSEQWDIVRQAARGLEISFLKTVCKDPVQAEIWAQQLIIHGASPNQVAALFQKPNSYLEDRVERIVSDTFLTLAAGTADDQLGSALMRCIAFAKKINAKLSDTDYTRAIDALEKRLQSTSAVASTGTAAQPEVKKLGAFVPYWHDRHNFRLCSEIEQGIAYLDLLLAQQRANRGGIALAEG